MPRYVAVPNAYRSLPRFDVVIIEKPPRTTTVESRLKTGTSAAARYDASAAPDGLNRNVESATRTGVRASPSTTAPASTANALDRSASTLPQRYRVENPT